MSIVLLAAIGPLIASFDYRELNTGASLSSPSGEHLLGTDFQGRDYFARMAAGAQLALQVSLIVVGITVLIAVPIGLLAGYRGGLFDGIALRIADLLLALPWFLIAAGLVASLGPGLSTVYIALIVAFVPPVVRLTRNSVFSVAKKEYVEAARSLGESHLSLMFRYVLANAYRPILVFATSLMAFAPLAEAALSYLGFGVQSPQSSWGLELANATQYLGTADHLAIFPGLLLAWFVIGVNLVGDGLGDLFAESEGSR